MERLDVPAPPAGTPGPLSRPTPAAIAGLLEGGGFSKVGVEQHEVTFEFDCPERHRLHQGDLCPIRAMIEQYAGEAQKEAWDAITQAAADAGGWREPAELLERGAARLGNRLAPASHSSGRRPRRAGRRWRFRFHHPASGRRPGSEPRRGCAGVRAGPSSECFQCAQRLVCACVSRLLDRAFCDSEASLSGTRSRSATCL